MFAQKLSNLLSRMLRPKPKYITVAAAGANAPSEPEKLLPPTNLPRHVAIIMDGNGRWAQNRSLPRSAGHAAGTEALREIIRASSDWGIEALSLYAFSTENWARSKDEVGALMALLVKYFNSEIDELDEKNVRILILGDIEGLPELQRNTVKKAMERTASNTGLKLNIALNYGGRAEIVRSARILAERAAKGEIKIEDITEDMFDTTLYTAGIPNVDLLIRTSGEVRTSNFLPWQTTYAEMIFDPILWPDYDKEHYLKNLCQYASRDRRFGGVKTEAADKAAEEKV